MKFFVALATLVAGAMSQGVNIALPTPGAAIASGTSFIVELQQAEAATNIVNVNVTIALTSCGGVCPDDPTQWPLGSVLYNGPFNPQRNHSEPQLGLFQDFVLEMPLGFTGDNVLNIYHLELTGVGENPYTEFRAVHVNVTS